MQPLQPLPASRRPISLEPLSRRAEETPLVGARWAPFNQGEGLPPSSGLPDVRQLVQASHSSPTEPLGMQVGSSGAGSGAAGLPLRGGGGGGGLRPGTGRYGASFASTGAFVDDNEAAEDLEGAAEAEDAGLREARANSQLLSEEGARAGARGLQGGGAAAQTGAVEPAIGWSVYFGKAWRRLC